MLPPSRNTPVATRSPSNTIVSEHSLTRERQLFGGCVASATISSQVFTERPVACWWKMCGKDGTVEEPCLYSGVKHRPELVGLKEHGDSRRARNSCPPRNVGQPAQSNVTRHLDR